MKYIIPKEFEVILAVFSACPLFIYGFIKAIIIFLIPIRYLGRTNKDISGQVALITGAGSGIGRLLAIEFSELGADVVLVDINKSGLLETRNLVNSAAKAFVYECDVSNRQKVYEMATLVKNKVGKVDIVVNNAGIVNGKRLLDLPDDRIQKIMEVNTLAHFWMCKAFLPDMMESNKGHIVAIASLAGVSGLPNLTDYCASKFAAVGFMESLKLELESQKLDGIKLTTVCPSLISTGLFEGTKPPLNVLMTPEYVAGEIMKAVLEEVELVILPRWMYLIILLKWTMPSIAVKRFFENSGLLEFMDTFRGRIAQNGS